ncbi:hypothetical protein Tco_1180134 [Tanacetum coccineum]
MGSDIVGPVSCTDHEVAQQWISNLASAIVVVHHVGYHVVGSMAVVASVPAYKPPRRPRTGTRIYIPLALLEALSLDPLVARSLRLKILNLPASTVGSAEHQLDPQSARHLGTLASQPRTGTAARCFGAC